MNILITAGGTVEKIDEVRQISNNSTGALGHRIAQAFLSHGGVGRVFYVCGKSALPPPDSEKIQTLRIGSVAELKDALMRIFSEHTVDGVVHCMAVSDYAVKTVTTPDLIGQAVSEECSKPESFGPDFKQRLPDIIRGCLGAENRLAQTGKISSDLDDLIVVLTKTPKIIGLFKTWQPQTVLAGFKLLNRVPRETLIEAGYALLQKNGCDFVLANDLFEVTPESHSGYLIRPDGSYERLCGRERIAGAIASGVIGQIQGKGGAKP